MLLDAELMRLLITSSFRNRTAVGLASVSLFEVDKGI